MFWYILACSGRCISCYWEWLCWRGAGVWFDRHDDAVCCRTYFGGGHFNMAVMLGLWAAGRFPAKNVVAYIMVQVVGGIIAWRAFRRGLFNGAAIVSEVVLTAGFLVVLLGVTDKHASACLAPIAIGFALTLIYLISIPVTNTFVNSARSTAVAIF